ncbi:hypothetical protein J6590_057652 [Homalodisca vitripennis]|nr:hypothetical protein J6590_057652 [Homalodisca vitripennis]
MWSKANGQPEIINGLSNTALCKISTADGHLCYLSIKHEPDRGLGKRFITVTASALPQSIYVAKDSPEAKAVLGSVANFCYLSFRLSSLPP